MAAYSSKILRFVKILMDKAMIPAPRKMRPLLGRIFYQNKIYIYIAEVSFASFL